MTRVAIAFTLMVGFTAPAFAAPKKILLLIADDMGTQVKWYETRSAPLVFWKPSRNLNESCVQGVTMRLAFDVHSAAASVGSRRARVPSFRSTISLLGEFEWHD